MRLVGTFKDPHRGQQFSLFLNAKGIHHQLDIHPNQDWGSEEYGTVHCEVWALEEEQYFEALRWFEEFEAHPFDPQFSINIPSVLPHIRLSDYNNPSSPETSEEELLMSSQPSKQFTGRITSIILGLCIALFAISGMTQPTITKIAAQLPVTPFATSLIYKTLFFDYPKAYVYIDQVIEKFGEEAAADPSQLPPSGKRLISIALATPYWKGLYPDLVVHVRSPAAPWKVFQAPLFEKIREGQVWRLITPIFLHGDIFHILFNMLWLLALGIQMEKILGAGRYLLFIAIAGVVPNIAQYLMSGSNFLGYSGVICAMLGFIWKRQKLAPWEGYQLQRSTVLFVTTFVLLILGIQFFGFIVEVAGNGSEAVRGVFANTAHLAGAVVGYLLGKCKFFAWRG